MYPRWIFEGAAFALDVGFDARDQANDNSLTSAFTVGFARKPFAFTATVAQIDSAHGISGGVSAAVVARPNDWAWGVRRIRVPISVAAPFIACSGKHFALIMWGRVGIDAEFVSRTGQSPTRSYLLGYGLGVDMELRNGLGFQFAFGGQMVRGTDPLLGALGLHFSTRPIPRVRPSKAEEGCRR